MNLDPLPIVPKSRGNEEQPREHLVPKKSKLSLLTRKSKAEDKPSEREWEQTKDCSDALRRIGVDNHPSTTPFMSIQEMTMMSERLLLSKRRNRALLQR